MIKKVRVEGYRLLRQFDADLGRLTVAIGANATGKSTLQDLLRLVAQLADRPINAVLRERGGFHSLLSVGAEIPDVSWRIAFTKPAENPFWASLPIGDGVEVVYEAALHAPGVFYGAAPKHEALRYNQAAQGDAGALTLLEYRDGRGRVYDSVARQLVDFGGDVPRVGEFSPQPQRTVADGNGGEPHDQRLQDFFGATDAGPSLLLAKVRFPQQFLHVSALRVFFSCWAFYPGFCVDDYSPIRRQPGDVESTTILGSKGENLATVLHEILTRHEYRKAAENLQDWLRAAYPELEQVAAESIPGAKGKVGIRWYEGLTRPLDASELSDGVLRFLCLAAVLNNPRPSPFIAIDEPEVGLHPRLLPVVADMVKAAAEQTQVLVTTHSPDFLDRFDLDDVAVMAREESNVRWHRPSSRRTLRTLLTQVQGHTLGELHRSGELEAGV